MPKTIIIKKKLDKGEKMAYENQHNDSSLVLSDRKSEEENKKVSIRRKEIIDALRSLEGVKRKLRKALESA